jgi:Ser/Thr protein kinase RdoA (MazF antagonist)
MKNIELKKFIENNWKLTNVSFIQLVQEKGGREVFHITSDEGSFVVKIYDAKATESEVIRNTEIFSLIKNSGFEQIPSLIKTTDDKKYQTFDGRFVFLMEYISGRMLTKSKEDEFKLGVQMANLHKIKNCDIKSGVDTKERTRNMLLRFAEYPFKQEYDSVVMNLPDFDKYEQCLIHTDIFPKNAIKNGKGEVILIDLDDAGLGSKYIDLGYPLITQFVQFKDRAPDTLPQESNEVYFDSETAKFFYAGYSSISPIRPDEKELIFSGAVFMQLMYMPDYGEEAVPFLWKQLKFAIENKTLLMKSLVK